MKRLQYSLLLLTLLADIHAADDPRIAARKLAREEAVQVAAIDKALSREMPDELKALPVFGEIIWMVKELPFIAKGPHAGVSGAGMVVVDGKIYFAGGFIPEGDGTQDTACRTSRWAHCYDPATDQWTQLPDLPARREYTRAIAGDNEVYVIGGAIQSRPTVPSADVYRLDVTQTPLAWKTVTPLQVPRTHQSVGKVGDRLIVAGGNNYNVAEKGYSEATVQGGAEVFDLQKPDAGWVKRAPIPGAPRGWCATSVVGDQFYILGGVTFHGSGKEQRAPRSRLQETLSYDPAKNEWKRHADFPYQISGWEGETYAGRYIITIGGAGARWNDLPFVYDTQEDRWLRSPSALPPGAMFNDPGVCIIGDTIYVAGGEGSGGSHVNHFLIGKIKPRPAPHQPGR
ncbi:MAG: kelch repeat-containing protein [Prosthecobacter sp.]|nr:kelch repeat-containing protein [Prosthecobacter sp.]